jgi:hypothetical protein
MNTIKFLTASTDMPRGAESKREKLPVPQPQMDEYRIYYNHRTIERDITEEETGEPESVSVPAADFVSVQADHEPTDAEWREVLSENGFDDTTIDTILADEG